MRRDLLKLTTLHAHQATEPPHLVVGVELLVLGRGVHDLVCRALPRPDAGSGPWNRFQRLVGRLPFGLEPLIAGSQVTRPKPAQNVGVECSAHLSLRPVPPFMEPPKRCFHAPLEKLSFDSVDAALEAQDVLQRVRLEVRSLLLSGLRAQQVLEALVRR